MSGHSKWATIKHQKAVKDARRGASFTKFANLISVAARSGAEIETNFKLRLAVEMAKKSGVPNANIERAIKRGAGLDGGTALEEVLYEGYGPGGVAVLVATATDNRNRTAAEVRSAFTKHGGSLGTSGSVAYQFDQKGVIGLRASDRDTATLAAIEAGAEDIIENEDGLSIFSSAMGLDHVRKSLQEEGYEIESAELTYLPQTMISLEGKAKETVIKLLDALDELDDVTETFTNAELETDPEQ
ncbi:MAG: YebC/PmpR family DNA-binding transcriptional regulator [Candidatus Saccharimonadia bacterium]